MHSDLRKREVIQPYLGRRKGGMPRESLRLEDSSSVQGRKVVPEMNHCPWKVKQLHSRCREVQWGVQVSR